MNALSVAWGFVKQHWQAILLVTLGVVSYAWVRHSQSVWADTLARSEQVHQQEVDRINAVRAQEVQDHQRELARLQTDLTKIQADFDAAQAQLAARQKQEERQIVKQYKDDMQGLAHLTADKLGLVIAAPQEQGNLPLR